MIHPGEFLSFLYEQGIDFFTGVPDSQLGEFCDYIIQSIGIGKQHIVAPNEGNAVALATGYHLATGKTGMVYMQNSGLGNAMNPITSLADPKVYSVPLLYMIGWRGMPGERDEPQHIKQGEITLDLLKLLGIDFIILDKENTMEEVADFFKKRFVPALKEGRSVAFVVKKGAFKSTDKYTHDVPYKLLRERAIELILKNIELQDAIVSTTGKISREVYEQRDFYEEGHNKDFLTVGAMGHSSMIALQIAEQKPEKRIWCLDGDGAMLMHTGALALIGSRQPSNFIHVLLNNYVHESVGGIPTIAESINFLGIAQACGYKTAYQVQDEVGLIQTMKHIKTEEGPILIQINVSNSSRKDLGRPKSSPFQNKIDFMRFLQG